MEKLLTLPGPRLAAAAEYIRKDSTFADIGTDHALLPIWAVTNGISRRAIASDVNEGPILRARENVARYGMEQLIECVISDGFDALDRRGITDAAICGMGGELIARIVERAEFIKTRGFRLILQPMTMLDVARCGITRAGFAILSETTVREGGKFYTIICAEYDDACGVIDSNSDVSSKTQGNISNDSSNADAEAFALLYGDLASRRFESDDVRRGYFAHEIAKYERIIDGKLSAGVDVDFERKIVRKLVEMSENVTK